MVADHNDANDVLQKCIDQGMERAGELQGRCQVIYLAVPEITPMRA